MTLAWFRPTVAAGPALLDDTVTLLAELARDHRVELFDQTSAHDFVWMHARCPYDLCVYELADTPAHAFVWPYVLHFPGVLRLRSPSLHRSRAIALNRARRREEYAAELAFSGWDMLRAPLLESRLVVVSDARAARQLREEYAGVAVRHAPLGFGTEETGVRPHAHAGVRFGSFDSRPGVLQRAAERTRAGGTAVELVTGSARDVLSQADVIVALDWPATDEWPLASLAAMSRATPAIVLETEATAGWPTFDPQTWQPRSSGGAGRPVAVSIDPRDDEHSLMLAMRRLAADPSLRDRIGAAGFEWWRGHATCAHAAEAWRAVLDEATTRVPPGRRAGWPAHLAADGTGRARAILDEFAIGVDFLR